MKKIIIPTILFLAALIVSFFALSQEKNFNQNLISKTSEENQSASQIILFYGDGCPHCKIVEEFIDNNNISEKMEFERKEVYYNKQNSAELGEKAKICGIRTNSIGVPFLWDGKNCFVGDKNIIDFFKNKNN